MKELSSGQVHGCWKRGQVPGEGMTQHLKSEVRGGYLPLALKRDRPAPRMLEREASGG